MVSGGILSTHSGNTSWIANRTVSNPSHNYKHSVIGAKATEADSTMREVSAWTTTISVEFVAKPNESQRLNALMPAAIASTMEGVSGFSGCAVMTSSQEERLVTVLTFWDGDLNARAAAANSGWICKLLERYVDHRLRVQTMRTRLAMAHKTENGALEQASDPSLDPACVPAA